MSDAGIGRRAGFSPAGEVPASRLRSRRPGWWVLHANREPAVPGLPHHRPPSEIVHDAPPNHHANACRRQGQLQRGHGTPSRPRQSARRERRGGSGPCGGTRGRQSAPPRTDSPAGARLGSCEHNQNGGGEVSGGRGASVRPGAGFSNSTVEDDGAGREGQGTFEALQ